MQIEAMLAQVGEQFRLAGKLTAFSEITRGNINSTYKADYALDGKTSSYIFQRINRSVFSEPAAIMQNIDLVTSYIETHYPEQVTLRYYPALDGRNYCVEDDAFWRVCDYYVSDAYDYTNDPEIIAGVGSAFGEFQSQLSGFDGSKLNETIPDFHNTAKRMQNLFDVVADDCVGRVATVPDEIAYLRAVAEKASELSIRYAVGEIPCRVTHNDTKANNVLFVRGTKKPLTVIDLDTVMPGSSLFDFGDAVRFIASTADEDEQDLSKVRFSTEKFRAFCRGYLGAVKQDLQAVEKENLVLAAFSITIEMAARFLTDYLQGDVYFRTRYPEHNLVRARCQIRLAQDMVRKRKHMEIIVREILGE